ncbi:TetR/AcrR family transcriptional regulator [Prescottella agglutinans]|uniref:TetR/AcrR family transcriptional regulator n=1 Tax=Prescottella agglutinans TaxID=1644129 RepID=A0A3S3BBW9_9NOCA|nr:TetR/AcrR family transcriptional regulator [Prescottella agglutinans]RVW07715.1 TetR/AcrR family transcriptional regulator [Prescottella agglutinans]
MNAHVTDSAAGTGRPRDPRIDADVLAATREMLVEVGWEQLSMRGIAVRAGVSRAALSRRWASKAHLVLDALLGATPDLEPFEGTDRAGWIDWVITGSAQLFSRPDVREALPGLLAALRDHEDLRTALWQGFSGPATELFAAHGADGPTPDETRARDLLDAKAVLVLASGAALFSSLIAEDDDTPELRARIRELLVPVADRPTEVDEE